MNGYSDPYASQYPYTDPRNPPPSQPPPHQYPIASTSQLPPSPPLPRPAVNWAGQIGYEGMGLPPGGSILVSTSNGQLPKTLPGGTELVKVTAKVRPVPLLPLARSHETDLRSGLYCPVLRKLSFSKGQGQCLFPFHEIPTAPTSASTLTSSRSSQCDRRYPECARCTKRKETCDYGDDVSMCVVSRADDRSMRD